MSAAIAAILVAACAKEKLVPEQENVLEGVNFVPMTFTASLDASKSTLSGGTKVFWEAGDEIAVFDGTVVNKFTLASGEGTASATFTGEVAEGSTDFYASMPYAACVKAEMQGDTLAKMTVAVPATQTIAEGGCIAPDAIVAVAMAEEGQLDFKNICSLAAFQITSDDVRSVQIKSNGGEYLTGNMVVTDTTSVPSGLNKVVVKPASGTFARGTYYATVLPAVLESGVAVTGVKADESIFLKKTDKKNEFEMNGGKDFGDILSGAVTLPTVIMTPAQMEQFGQNSAYYPSDVTVKLGDNINMTDIAWAAADFDGIFDGQNHSIYNFTVQGDSTTTMCGIFGNLRGTLRNTVFGSVDCMSWDGVSTIKSVTSGDKVYPYLGIVAKTTGASVTLERVNNFAKVEFAGADSLNIYCGGVVGAFNATSGSIEDCKNYGEVLISTRTKEAANLAGVVGALQGTANVTGCYNYGHVLYNGSWHYASLNEGGVVGYCNKAVTFDGCSNEGLVEIGSGVSVVPASYAGQRGVGGIVGYNQTNACTVKNCTNSGMIARHGGTKEDHANYMGGIVGYTNVATQISDCQNTKDGIVENTKTSSGRNLFMGGIVGYNATTAGCIEGCTNAAEIRNSQTATLIHMAGILGSTTVAVAIDDCSNTGKVSNSYQSSNGSSNTTPNIALGGIAGRGGVAIITNCTNSALIDNTGNLNYGGNLVAVGGITGVMAGGKMEHCTSTGSVNCKSGTSSKKAKMLVGGVLGYVMTASMDSFTDNHNNGETLTVAGYGSQSRVGGVLGNAAAAACINIDHCSNAADISISFTDSYNYIGGILGDVPNGSLEPTISYCSNTGNIVAEEPATASSGLRIGGICGSIASLYTVENCTSSGNITNNSPSVEIRLGGITGSTSSTNSIYRNCTVTGTILNTNSAADKAVRLGGLNAYIGTGSEYYGCSSAATIKNTFAATAANEQLGGLVGYSGPSTAKYDGCTSTGDIFCVNSGLNYVGAIAGKFNTNPGTFTNCFVGPLQIGTEAGPVTLTAENYGTYLKGSANTKGTNCTTETVTFLSE